ncbi:MAG: ExbD/TolR family protein [Synechococcus lacustris]|jgi:biopolymer transport protein ExbD
MSKLNRWQQPRRAGLGLTDIGLVPEANNTYWLPLVDLLLVLIAFCALLIPTRLGLNAVAGGYLPIRINAAGDTSLQGQPVPLRRLPALVKAYANLHPGGRLRLLPDPEAPWGVLGPVLVLLKDSPTPVDLKLSSRSISP